MNRPGKGLYVVTGFLVLPLLVGCHSSTPSVAPEEPALLIPSPAVPRDVKRLAVFYPKSSNPEWMEAYARLESAAFQLKQQRPDLKIVDRFNLPLLLGEHRLQWTGSVSEDSAIRLGRLLGVDSVLIYRIEGPTTRDRFFARHSSDLPPITVLSKIIKVESAEVVYHNVVSARADEGAGWELSDSLDVQRVNRTALERGIRQTVNDLRQAFQ
jgi:hypothetical protein